MNHWLLKLAAFLALGIGANCLVTAAPELDRFWLGAAFVWASGILAAWSWREEGKSDGPR